MKKYVSLLRGINVSGRNSLKMDVLRKLYVDMGFRNVSTYLQSGNVIFQGEEEDCQKIAQRISLQIAGELGLQVPLVVISPEKLKRIIDGNPFQHDADKDITSMYVCFLASVPAGTNREAIESKRQKGEEILISGDAVYLYCPGSYGRTRLNNNFLEEKLSVVATTRNWKTTRELYRMMTLLS